MVSANGARYSCERMTLPSLSNELSASLETPPMNHLSAARIEHGDIFTSSALLAFLAVMRRGFSRAKAFARNSSTLIKSNGPVMVWTCGRASWEL